MAFELTKNKAMLYDKILKALIVVTSENRKYPLQELSKEVGLNDKAVLELCKEIKSDNAGIIIVEGKGAVLVASTELTYDFVYKNEGYKKLFIDKEKLEKRLIWPQKNWPIVAVLAWVIGFVSDIAVEYIKSNLMQASSESKESQTINPEEHKKLKHRYDSVIYGISLFDSLKN